jgi:hypothetical protein
MGGGLGAGDGLGVGTVAAFGVVEGFCGRQFWKTEQKSSLSFFFKTVIIKSYSEFKSIH